MCLLPGAHRTLLTVRCLAEYAQIPLFAGRAVPPFDQMTRFSRMDMCSMSRKLAT